MKLFSPEARDAYMALWLNTESFQGHVRVCVHAEVNVAVHSLMCE